MTCRLRCLKTKNYATSSFLNQIVSNKMVKKGKNVKHKNSELSISILYPDAQKIK
jgi:hypothetical protein